MLAENQRVKDESVGDAELTKAIKQARAEFVYANEAISDQAYCLGRMEMVDSYRRQAAFLDRLSFMARI